MTSTRSEDLAKSEAYTIVSCFSKSGIVHTSLKKYVKYFIDLPEQPGEPSKP